MAQLYIKLDKKLIVHIDQLDIDKETQTDTSLEEISAIIENLPYLNQFFKDIDIKTLNYDNEKIHLSFKENLFNFDSQHATLALEITPISLFKVELKIQSAYLKDYFLSLQGKANIDFKSKIYTYEGMYALFGIQGNTLLEIKNSLLKYHFESETFTNQNLKAFMDFLVLHVELESLVKDWIDTKIIAQQYQLHSLDGQLDLNTWDYFPLLMKGTATATDALVQFEPSVPPAHIDVVGLELKEDKLLFDVHNGTYVQKHIQYVDVYIDKLLTVGTKIIVDLNTSTALLNDDIHKILHAFHIDVPITQTTGKTDAHVNLDIKFLPYAINATGEFTVTDSNFTLADVPMFSKNATIKLDNYNVYLDKANLHYKDLFDINATGLFDTKIQTFNGLVDMNAVKLYFGTANLLDIKMLKEQNATLVVDGNDTRIELPALGTKILFASQNNQFHFFDLSKIAPHSPLMRDNTMQAGTLDVMTKDFSYFTAMLHLNDLQTPFLENNQTLKALSLAISTDTHSLDAKSTDGKLSAHFDTNLTVHVNDLNISLPKSDTHFESPLTLQVIGTHSSFVSDDDSRTILSDAYQLTLDKDTILLRSKYKNSTFDYERNNGVMNLLASSLDAHFVNVLLGKTYFDKGNFSLQLEGSDDTHYDGTFIMHETFIKDMKFFDNLMSTINAIPSLIAFSDPKFGQNGYFVKNGYIEYTRNTDQAHIKEMKLTGNNADIEGQGDVDFQQNTIELALRIQTLSAISNAIDFIPLVGGIILGDDKRIATNIDVNGNLNDPKITTHLLLDTIQSPINIIKRTIEAPMELFKK
ncbi:MAG: AsmA-like C-terminal domain-containing protein [Sulfurospirillaceae bacterium]|nr:AsmA-like C-terminal domain-containing protein [Sulfurospirillaceae bacterium]